MELKNKYKIAIGGISTECCTYSPLTQNKNDFEFIENKNLLKLINYPFAKNNIRAIPLFFAKSLPGGPIDHKSYINIKNKLINLIKKERNLDGILLLMHGAMYVKNIFDPEGELIFEIRKLLGNKAIIAVTYDLHGQITNKIIKNIDIFSAYKTAPHIDIKQTYKKTADLLSKSLNKKINTKVLWTPIPILVSGEMSSTNFEPCKTLFKSLSKIDNSKIYDVSLMIGYVWADTKRATAAVVVTYNDLQEAKKICKKISINYWNIRKKLKIPGNFGKLNDFKKWFPNKFCIISDSGDNPTAGGVGDRADILYFFLKNNYEKFLIAGIAAPKTYKKLKQSKSFIIGNQLGGGGPQLNLIANKVRFSKNCAIVNINNNVIIITKNRQPFHYLNDFKNLNIDINNFNILVVKQGYLSPELYKLSQPNFMLLSDGAVNQNIIKIKNHNRLMNTYPFKQINKFKPKIIF
tara:strand:- start:1004 stop:2392 length:1389 start_codon:yes stop_codon:yes gene_type:complete